MSSYDAKKIEEYQMILMKNPRSKVFAALCETYRKMQMHEEALDTAFRGVQHNPDYASGLVALARILVDLKKFDEAIPHLESALQTKPENLLALRILAHCRIQQKKLPEALKAYKSLLFLNPNDASAQEFVQKWEFLEGAEYDFDHPLLPPEELEEWLKSLPGPEALINVMDVFISKEDNASAKTLMKFGLRTWPDHPKLLQRQRWVLPRQPQNPILQAKKAFWQKWIQRIEQRKNIDPLRI